jgi:1-acyl-sn-glycerol-3-phosphate acyltransferase
MYTSSNLILNNILYQAGGKLVKAYSKFMLNMSIASYSHIPGGAKIIVANHPTTTDPFLLTSISNGQAAVLIKDTLFDVPVFGRYLHWAGHIPVRDGRGAEAFESALEKLKRGITVIVFIEGGLSKFAHKMDKSKTGAVRLALVSGKPIIPIGIGIREKNVRLIKSIIKGVQEIGKWYLKGPYALTIGKPISFKGNVNDRGRVKSLSELLGKKIGVLQKESAQRLP